MNITATEARKMVHDTDNHLTLFVIKKEIFDKISLSVLDEKIGIVLPIITNEIKDVANMGLSKVGIDTDRLKSEPELLTFIWNYLSGKGFILENIPVVGTDRYHLFIYW